MLLSVGEKIQMTRKNTMELAGVRVVMLELTEEWSVLEQVYLLVWLVIVEIILLTILRKNITERLGVQAETLWILKIFVQEAELLHLTLL